ncbi:MAG: NAD-dependent malic enzyme [Chlamydiia bacterium]|nr:NAD-dependent malic enzyme [Chlamydiia bacterium]
MSENRKPRVIETNLGPQEILRTPLLNKGTGFTEKEREELGLKGLLPHHVSDIKEQLQRRYRNYSKRKTDLARYVYLTTLQDRNEVLFYRLASEHTEEMLPYIYTPTVGDASLDYSNLYSQNRGVYIAYAYKDQMKQMIKNIPRNNVDVIVVTDGSRILGLGDMGIGGMTIPVGKLSLYTLFGGVDPSRTLPVILDVGTNNPKLLDDPLYLGWRHSRITGQEYDDFVDSFVQEIKKRFPDVLLQWEDFSRDNASTLLNRYQDQICSFNDDIQGTASVALAGILASLKSLGKNLKDQHIAIAGGGSAGLGIASLLVKSMMQEGLTEKQAKSRFYITDRDGLIHSGREITDKAQKVFEQSAETTKDWSVKDKSGIALEDVVSNAKPSILLGLTAHPKLFTQEIIKTMCKNTERPVIFPLSNPTSKAEASPEDITKWSKGKAIIATGSPPKTIDYDGRSVNVAQCNNVYIFPGVGLATIATKSSVVTDEMFLIAADVLSNKSPLLNDPDGSIFPRIKNLREVSKEIAIEVARHVLEKGYAKVDGKDPQKLVEKTLWYPEYPIIKKRGSI